VRCSTGTAGHVTDCLNWKAPDRKRCNEVARGGKEKSVLAATIDVLPNLNVTFIRDEQCLEIRLHCWESLRKSELDIRSRLGTATMGPVPSKQVAIDGATGTSGGIRAVASDREIRKINYLRALIMNR